jgi:hypothetical protein
MKNPIQTINLFYTPTSMEDLQDKLALHYGSEGVVAQTAAWMAWNLASKIVEEQLQD